MLRLKSVLSNLGISQAAYIAEIFQTNGQPLSKSAGSQLLNKGVYPRATSVDSIQDQTIEMLREKLTRETRELSNNELKNYLFEDLKTAGDSDQTNTRQTDKLSELPETEMLSQKARKHFALFQDPFRDDVQGPEDVYLSAEQRYIRESMYQAAKHGGFIAVIGESGAGKTTLRRDLIDRVNRSAESGIVVIQPRTIDKTKLTAAAICDAIIGDLGSESPKRTLEGKARQIERLLVGSSRAGNSHVLMIEEAHDITIPVFLFP